ncbi:MAG: DUF1194 domain-containing protein [Rhizobiaceae bacterium]|nr:DUF1194 domain-containing protein [Rhizobiaceae bacterium]
MAGLAGATACALAGTSPASAQEVVDVELILAVDVSLSMSFDELKIQRDGYVAALTHDQVISAIRNGIHGKIAISYFEWAGDQSHYMVVPWTVIASREDAERVAAQITASPPNSARRTSISGGLRFAYDLFAESAYSGLKRVVDVSGDGPNNQGEWVDVVRDDIISRGITINGLPLMTDGGLMTTFGIPDLDRYYTHCVIGGPGAFVVPVNDWSHFPEAVRRKLVLEIAGGPSVDPWPEPEANPDELPVVKVATEPGYDCQVGEKRWRGRTLFWEDR